MGYWRHTAWAKGDRASYYVLIFMIAITSLVYWGARFEYAVLAALIVGFYFVTSAVLEVTATLEEEFQERNTRNGASHG